MHKVLQTKTQLAYHRFKIDLTLAKLSLSSTADASFVEVRIENGVVTNKVNETEYALIEDTLARRTFDESGDYTIRPFELDVREHLLSGTNRGINATGTTSTDGNTVQNQNLYWVFLKVKHMSKVMK